MKTSHFASALSLALAGGAAAYVFGTTGGRTAGRRALGRASDSAADSAAWLRGHTPDFSQRLAHIEQQIDTLGDDLRRRLDALQQQAARSVQPSFDAEPWSLSGGDVQRDLPGLPRK